MLSMTPTGHPVAGRQRGVTLIELAVALVVFGVLLVAAFPNFIAWIRNTQVRTATEAVLNGIQLARAEAVRRNTVVQFVIVPNTITWTVGCVIATADCPATIQARSVEEGGSANTVPTIEPGGATTLTFNGMGRVVANDDGSPSITHVEVDSRTLSAAESRELRVMIAAGGSVKMCDPSPYIADDDPRVCPK
jgi:type IV fimbrial biogenesis protein FimT